MLTGYEHLQSARNQFKPHFNLFLDEKITLLQLESICFAWTIKNESLYKEKPLPTEPLQYYGTNDAAFAVVMKAWHLGCNSMEMENKSNVRCFKKAEKFFLKSDNDYDEGIELFKKYEAEEIVPF